MNTYLILIITFIVATYLLENISTRMNINSMTSQLPQEFNDVINRNEYDKLQHYNKRKEKFSLITSTITTLVTLAFILLGGFNVIDIFARSFNYGEISTGLIFFGSLFLLNEIVSIPISLYSTFVIEEEFGFNKTTLKTFISDKIKSYILAAIIGGIFVSCILWFFGKAGTMAWLWCWLFAMLVTLIIQYITPTFLLPIFFKFSPIEDGELKTAIEKFATKNSFKLSGIFIIDGSTRSTKANAFFTGFGNKKRIALFDTLLEQATTDEIIAILAHEIGHSKLGHIKKTMFRSMLEMGVTFFIMSFFLGNEDLFAAFKMTHISIYAGLLFFTILYSPVSTITSIFGNIYSRKNEYEADTFSVQTTKMPEALVSGLKKLTVKSLSNLTPHPFYVFLNYSHPTTLQRIKNIRSLEV